MSTFKFERHIKIYDLSSPEKLAVVKWYDTCTNEEDGTVFALDPEYVVCFIGNASKVKQELQTQFGRWKAEVRDSDNLNLLEDYQ